MRYRPARIIQSMAIAISIALLSPSYSGPAEARTQVQQMREAFEALAKGTLDRKSTSEKCLLNLSTTKKASSMRQVMAGFLGESRSTSFVVLCDVLVEAVVTDLLTPQAIYDAMANVENKTRSLAFGRLLRVVYFIHFLLPETPASKVSGS